MKGLGPGDLIAPRFDVSSGRHQTALHESAHVVARLSRGWVVPAMHTRGRWLTEGTGQMVDVFDGALVAMAGQAAEGIMWRELNGKQDADVQPWLLEKVAESRRRYAEAEEFGEDLEDYWDDITAAGPYAEVQLIAALALVSTHWEAVEKLAAAALATPSGSVDWDGIKAVLNIGSEEWDTDEWCADEDQYRRWVDLSPLVKRD